MEPAWISPTDEAIVIDTATLGDIFDRTVRALTKRPSLGRSTATSTARITNGLVCEVQEGKWRFTADMPEQVGGTASGPTPGVLGRAALGSCLAIGYVLHAAKAGIPIGGVEVTVEADFDDGALFGVADAPAGYLEVRYAVTITSDAAEVEIRRMLDDADAHSPYHDVFSRGQKMVRSVRVEPMTAAGATEPAEA
jgi:uncharacterized OsmC-like protein